ncbi:MAG TPA: hypothetical protein VN258_06405 [Mobilitalea sp.]|nr:hypothetical protein [Mobilitalea sp.]
MKKIISFLLILTVCLTTTPAVNTDAKQNYKKLSAGEYVVGEDISSGKYDLRGVDGWGLVYIYKSEDDYDNSNALKLICLCSKDYIDKFKSVYTTTYHNLKLKKGYYISVQYTLTVKFTSQ